MRKALTYILLLLFPLALSAQIPGKVVEMKGSFLEQIQERDSVLIADQLRYGFDLTQVEEGTVLGHAQLGDTLMTNIRVVSSWAIDTLKVSRQKKGMPKLYDIRSSVTITSFDEGNYILPPLAVLRMSKDNVVDTLVFEPQRLEVRTMPVDTATFVPHDIKGQIRYPVTFKEVAPWAAGGMALAGLIWFAVWLVMRYRRNHNPEYARRDPAHIVALRKLDKYRGSAMWAPEKQKDFYSGVTDALREYISERYGVGAMEMTTAELFNDLKDTDVPKELAAELRELFERADFVKFAKFTASDEDNASVLPVAVRFVTSTYQTDVEDEISPVTSADRNDVEMENEIEKGGE